MRRICTLLLSIVLLLTLSVTAFAAEENLKIHTATAKKGETVYVTVELTESTVGNAMAVMYSYNEKHLKPVPASCSWAIPAPAACATVSRPRATNGMTEIWFSIPQIPMSRPSSTPARSAKEQRHR